eukprot:gnl/TRDRNA2_/TRDRNA2_127844_c0_seq2.p1 gnl/TRDRNA2_/TRDRNA2_127844_c0~~gnl/TRDRNA2_/TRDRNA2_127844_c0_seq2.p1  ORF type:complete len:230 (+),score=21.14 gnl/TRDRNA2_/TRDRNA2_127844_c0_seq2:381-1070(+)
MLVVGGDDHHLSKTLGDVELFFKWFDNIFYEAKDISHPSIRTFPCGLCEHYYRGHEEAMIEAIQQASFDAKEELVMAAWGKFWKQLDNTSYRKCLATFCEESAFVRRQDVPFEKWFSVVSKHKFILCPGGRGIQEPKVIEALLVLTIPVVLRCPAYDDLTEDGFPLLLVNTWTDVTETMLNDAWAAISVRLPHFRSSRLSGSGCFRFYRGQEPVRAMRPILFCGKGRAL